MFEFDESENFEVLCNCFLLNDKADFADDVL